MANRFHGAIGEAVGPQLLTLPVFLTGFFASTLLRLLGTPFQTESMWIEELIDGWAAFLLFWIWIQTVTRALVRLGESARYWVLGSVVLGAAARGALVDYLIGLQESEPVDLLGYRMLSSVLLVGVLMLLASYALSFMSQQSARLTQLEGYRKNLSGALSQSQIQIDTWFVELVSEAKSRMLGQLGGRINLTPQNLSERLKDLISNAVRPISAELSRGLPPTPKLLPTPIDRRPSLPAMISAAATSHWRVRPILTPIVIGLISTPSVALFGNASVLEVFTGFFILHWAGLYLANWLFQNKPESWSVFISAATLQTLIILSSVLPAYYTVWRIGFLESRPAYFHNSALILTLGFSLVTLLVATVDATSRGVRQVESELEGAVAELRWLLAKTKGEMWRRQQELARVIHGPLQASLTASAIRLDLAKSSEDRALLVESAIEDAFLTIDSIDKSLTNEPDFESELASVGERWQGICKIESATSAATMTSLREDPTAARIVLDLIHDALSNAVRHGSASRAAIEIRESGEELVHVVVTDNGRGLNEEFGAGIGSYHLDVLTTDWILTNRTDGKHGARLDFYVPVETRLPGKDASFAKSTTPSGAIAQR